MDYEIRRKKSDLDSTGYMEIGPGKYSGKHWQDGFLFVCENSFGVAEGIIMKHFKDYDHYGINNIPKEEGLSISSEWLHVASALKNAGKDECQKLLNLDVVYKKYMEAEVFENRASIIKLLVELSNSFEQFYKMEEWICILGV